MPFAATWVDLEIVILNDVRQREILHDIAYMPNLERNDKSIYKIETDSQTKGTNLWSPGRKTGGRDR